MPGKRTALVSSLAGLCLLFSLLGYPRSAAGGRIPEQVWDFGVVPQKSEVSHWFYLRNTGREPLVVSKIKVGCSCISAPELPDPIPPGDSAAVPVTFKSGRYTGHVRKTTRIHAGDDKNAIQSLVIVADVHSDGLTGLIRVDPPRLKWTPDDDGFLSGGSDTITLVNDGAERYEVTVLDVPNDVVYETGFPVGRMLGSAFPLRISVDRVPAAPVAHGPSITLLLAGPDTIIVTVPIELKD